MIGMFDPISPQAHAISDLFILVLGVCAVIFAVVTAIVAYAILRSRRERARGEAPADAVENDNHWLEAAWTAIPLLIVAGIFVLSVRVAGISDPAFEGPPDVIVRGHQWWWEIEYPGTGVITANELHIPVDQRMHLLIESGDVLHDFWVPSLSRKIDMVPGRDNHLVFAAQTPGRYEGACAEFCGDQHAWMRLEVFVHARPKFDAWLAAQALPAAPPETLDAQAGLEIYNRETCSSCHMLRGAEVVTEPVGIGPDLTHLASRNLIGAGVLVNDEANLYAWLKDPQAIKEGCHMPNFQLTDRETAQLTAYLSNLQ